MRESVDATCHTDFQASRHSGVRPLSAIRYVVMHDTEGGTARSTAKYFAEVPQPNGQPGGSAHLVVDDDSCYRCLTNAQVPWGAPGANEHGFHIEQCGYAHWTTAEWETHRPLLERAAYKAALHCHLFGLPAVFVDAAGLHAGAKGITTHAEVTKAYGGTHTDPGSGWPRALFMAATRQFLASMQAA